MAYITKAMMVEELKKLDSSLVANNEFSIIRSLEKKIDYYSYDEISKMLNEAKNLMQKAKFNNSETGKNISNVCKGYYNELMNCFKNNVNINILNFVNFIFDFTKKKIQIEYSPCLDFIQISLDNGCYNIKKFIIHYKGDLYDIFDKSKILFDIEKSEFGFNSFNSELMILLGELLNNEILSDKLINLFELLLNIRKDKQNILLPLSKLISNPYQYKDQYSEILDNVRNYLKENKKN